jgi:alkylation response protein AidB-like acyl-CoA dehydrogenase
LDFSLTTAQRALQAEAREFCQDAAISYPTSADSWMIGHSPELSIELGERGWIGMTWPTSVGGAGLGNLERLLVASS